MIAAVTHVGGRYAVVGGLACLLLASCAALTGLGDYEIGADSVDGGGPTTSNDANFPADQAADAPATTSSASSSGASSSSSSGSPGPTVACGPTCAGADTTCFEEPCGSNLKWQANGMVSRNDGSCVFRVPAYVTQTIDKEIPSRFAVVLSFTLAIGDVTEGTVAQILVNDKFVYSLTVDENFQLNRCNPTGPTSVGCANVKTLVRDTALDLDLYAYFDGSTWRGSLAMGTNTCPGERELQAAVPGLSAAPSKIEARVGYQGTGRVKFDIGNIRLDVHPN